MITFMKFKGGLYDMYSFDTLVPDFWREDFVLGS